MRKRRRRIVGALAAFVALAALVVPQWVLALRYRPPQTDTTTNGVLDVPVLRAVVDEHVDVPATFTHQGSALLPIQGATSAHDLDIRVPVGGSVTSGSLIGFRSLSSGSSGGTTREPVFFLACASPSIADVEPGESSPLVGCLQAALATRQVALPAAERVSGTLGSATQQALSALYRSQGAEPPTTDDDLDVKRVSADAALLQAQSMLRAAQASPDKSAIQIAGLQVLAAAIDRNHLYNSGGTRLIAGDFLVAPTPQAVYERTTATPDGGLGVDLSWGEVVLAAVVSDDLWATASGAKTHEMVRGSTALPVQVASSTAGPAGQRLTFSAGPSETDQHFFVEAHSSTGLAVRFVIRSSGHRVPSVPIVAVQHSDGLTFLLVRGRGGRHERLPVRELGEISGRSILADTPRLARVQSAFIG
jgi:hypothetical protein